MQNFEKKKKTWYFLVIFKKIINNFFYYIISGISGHYLKYLGFIIVPLQSYF